MMGFSKSVVRIGGIILIVLGGLFAGLVLMAGEDSRPPAATPALTSMNFSELTQYFTALAEERGAEEAFEELLIVQLPPNTDLHLLAHAVGDTLYAQQGVAGIAVCTDDFRNACSHAIVIGALLEYGEGALPQVREACKKAPGGSGAYTMCFHGFGHGVLAYYGYEMEDAVAFCRLAGTEEYHHREYVECVGGAVMEILSGGGHDREVWEEQHTTYLASSNPLALCQYEFITPDIAPMCYTYLTPHLFQFDGGDMGRPTERDYQNAFAYCNTLSAAHEPENRAACFGGLGKEFVVLAQGRDIRALETLSEAQLSTVHRWCALAEVADGRAACVTSAVQSLYWGGENEPALAVRFCDATPTDAVAHIKDTCYENLFTEVDTYVQDVAYRTQFCELVGDVYTARCKAVLL